MLSEERLDRDELAAQQADRLAHLLSRIYGRNRFYTRKLDAAGLDVESLRFPRDLARLPLTTKTELVEDQVAHPPWGTALTLPIEAYTRFCQTSSTTGAPLRWVDTSDSWQWMLDCWKEVYGAARVGPGDRAFFPFSFGPFLGFWAGFEAACQLGVHAIPGGGMSSRQRLSLMEVVGATVVCCTPTYALRLAEVAAEHGARLADSRVRVLIVAGEPGGSIPSTRRRIEEQWGARVIDHHGLTEVGPVSFECWEMPGFLHVNEREFICEVLGSDSVPVGDGERGELVMTNLGRVGSPVIRYRTGDIVVRQSERCRCGRTWARLEGGVLARADDMVNVRGVNVYPSAIEAIVRGFVEIVEFRSVVSRLDTRPSLAVDIEAAPPAAAPGVATRLADRLRECLGLTVPVTVLEAGTLPRFEMKARRFVIER